MGERVPHKVVCAGSGRLPNIARQFYPTPPSRLGTSDANNAMACKKRQFASNWSRRKNAGAGIAVPPMGPSLGRKVTGVRKQAGRHRQKQTPEGLRGLWSGPRIACDPQGVVVLWTALLINRLRCEGKSA